MLWFHIPEPFIHSQSSQLPTVDIESIVIPSPEAPTTDTETIVIAGPEVSMADAEPQTVTDTRAVGPARVTNTQIPTPGTSGQGSEPSSDRAGRIKPEIFAFYFQMDKAERWPKNTINNRMKSLASAHIFAKIAGNNTLKYIDQERRIRSIDMHFVICR